MTEESKTLIQQCIDYDGLNHDSYALLLDEGKIVALCRQEMDDHFCDNGITVWAAELPRELVEGALAKLVQTGEARFEAQAVVKKHVRNKWVYGLEEKEEEYPYQVRVEMKRNDKTELKIWFQDCMDIYF